MILSTITFYLKSLNFMEKVRDYVFRQILVRMYEALILHYFDHYSEVWGCLANCLSDRLQKLQNRAARIINYFRATNIDPLPDFLNDLGWETLGQRRKKHLAVCAYKSINKLVPVGQKSLFEPISQVHAYTLRGSSNNIFIRTPETNATRNSYCYSGAVLWNTPCQ